MTNRFSRKSGGRWLRLILRLFGCSLVTLLLLFVHSVSASTTPCLGDCWGDEQVTVDDLIKGVNNALGTGSLDQCQAFDCKGNGRITIDELVAAVNSALGGCDAT